MKVCAVCNSSFQPSMPLQRVCSLPCAIKSGSQKTAKIAERKRKAAIAKERRDLRSLKLSIKTLSDWRKDAQKAFNAYIRERDHDLPCISCGDFTPMTRGGDYDCGHYRSVGANPELRFEELNCHKQCKRCNRYLTGNHVNYRIGLLMRIGEEKVAWLEGNHKPMRYRIEELQAIAKAYRQKLKELKQQPVYPV